MTRRTRARFTSSCHSGSDLTFRPDTRPSGEPIAVSRLAVTRLRLTNFRSYATGEIVVSGRPVVLAGPNGAGKTNILDAISLLSPGRGIRGARHSDHIRKAPLPTSGTALWAVAATVMRDGECYEIGTGLVPSTSVQSEKR